MQACTASWCPLPSPRLPPSFRNAAGPGGRLPLGPLSVPNTEPERLEDRASAWPGASSQEVRGCTECRSDYLPTYGLGFVVMGEGVGWGGYNACFMELILLRINYTRGTAVGRRWLCVLDDSRFPIGLNTHCFAIVTSRPTDQTVVLKYLTFCQNKNIWILS